MALDKETVLRAWKDGEFRAGMSPEDRAALPERPLNADGATLTDQQLEAAAGGASPYCPGGYTLTAPGHLTIIVDG